MTLETLRQTIATHQPSSNEEKASQQAMLALLRNPRCLLRENLAEHFTASTFIVNPDRTKTLLTHHRKIGRWLQLGGHADGNPDLAAVAMTEGLEESGLTSLRLASDIPFDLDVHEIAEHKGVPKHLHHDVAFLVEADPDEPLVVSAESIALAWVDIQDPRIVGHTRLQRMSKNLRN